MPEASDIGGSRLGNLEPLRRQVESRRAEQLSAESTKRTIYRAYIEEACSRLATLQA